MEIAPVVDDAVRWRRHLHAHPELSFHEDETARFVHKTLESFGGGLEIGRPTPTSVVARLHGARQGKVLALRADIDALPITEESGVEFSSRVDGVMHACGHDGHTAMLLAVARVLGDRVDDLAGEVRFVFQHAEELPPGGAAELVAAGALDGVDAVLGCHLLSGVGLGLGKVAAAAGPCTAAADVFSATIRGRGGHAAFPHGGIDPIAVAAQAISNLQQVVSRTVSPLDSAVLSVTRISGGTADNVIPESVELGGTVRTFRPEVRSHVRETMARILDGVAAAHGAACELDYVEGYDPVVNDPSLAALVRDAAGEGNVAEFGPIMGGDDFSALLRVAPGCFFFVGSSEPGAPPHHHPGFTLDERALPVGIETFVGASLRFLAV